MGKHLLVSILFLTLGVICLTLTKVNAEEPNPLALEVNKLASSSASSIEEIVKTVKDNKEVQKEIIKIEPAETKEQEKPINTSVVEAAVDKKVPEEIKENELSAAEELEQLKVATQCDIEKCQLPNCRCSEQTLPVAKFEGKEKEIPQFISVTFDDAMRADSFEIYQKLFNGLVNPDHCPVRGTFFVSHEYTDYAKLNELFAQGHEIALHSISHRPGTEYWKDADMELIEKEFGDQITIIERLAKINRKYIHGMRMPFLQLAGNTTYLVAKKLGLKYDSSWPSQNFRNEPLWPYTLDYRSTQDCQIGPCPKASIPGMWVSPMVSWQDTKGYFCAMMDACVFPPENKVDALFEWMKENFERHYNGNRAPFGIYLHSSWFARASHNMEALRKFMEHLATLPDAYMVPIHRVIEYMREPVLGKPFKGCPKRPFTSCKPRRCTVRKVDTDELRYMTVCDRCPAVFPWLGNPMGKLN